MAGWPGTIKTTASKHLKGFIDGTLRKRLWFRMMEEKGRISLGHNGRDVNWLLQYKEPPVNPYGDGGVINFSRHDLWQSASLTWRAYKATDLMTRMEALENSGSVAIIERYAKILPNLMRSLVNTFSGELYVDGNAAGNENRIHGVDSLLGDDGATVAADRIARPSDTYAGLSTTPAAISGSWSADMTTPPNATLATDWPFGQGDTDYEYNSPVLGNISSTNWGTGSTSWEDNCEIMLIYMLNWLTHRGGDDGVPDMFMLATDLMTGFQTKQLAKQQIIVPHKKSQDLGIENVLNFNGVMVGSEYDCPSGEFRVLNSDQMQLCSIDKVLFYQEGPDWDERTNDYLFQCGFHGNMRFYPKYFGKGKRYA